MTLLDVDTADVRKLSEALRRECEKSDPKRRLVTTEEFRFAAALLGALDWATGRIEAYDYSDAYRPEYPSEAAELIRAISTRYVAAGGELREGE